MNYNLDAGTVPPSYEKPATLAAGRKNYTQRLRKDWAQWAGGRRPGASLSLPGASDSESSAGKETALARATSPSGRQIALPSGRALRVCHTSRPWGHCQPATESPRAPSDLSRFPPLFDRIFPEQALNPILS